MSQQQKEGGGFTLVYYYIPEDCDDLAMPNAYAIPKGIEAITLSDIEGQFPLKGEEFHFRFKYKYNGASVWLDLANKQCKVPKVDGRIIMKVTRKVAKNGRYLSIIIISVFAMDDAQEDGVDVDSLYVNAGRSAAGQGQSSNAGNIEDFFGGGSAQQQPLQRPVQSQYSADVSNLRNGNCYSF